ncbi:L,D-transpeptidase family protein [Isoptericola halotolerans]|uniref:L,D-transpeptidase family protein n=1 Tax=Isoptericola halotolerans TaxID=300560 RepID=UPI00388E42DF
MTTTTSLRRATTAAAVALTLLVVPGCAALADLSGTGAAADPPATPSAAATSDAPTATPSATPTPSPPSASPSVAPSTSPTPSPEPSPSAEPSEEPSPEPSPTPEEDADDAPADEQAEQDADEQKKEPSYPERGASGKKVRALQEQLIELGYFLPEADGAFGPQTQQAVWALQKAAGLGRDAVVGPKTRQALKDGARPSARSSQGKVVEIDLDRQLLLAVEDGRVVRTINASSGNGETFEAKGRSYRATTPRGTFAVYMERDYLHESTLELGAMYRPKYFTGGIAVHGSPSIPPWPASHGCIRVSNSAMNWLWDDWGMPQGTTVLVY